tara:strand:- start:1198 stop:1320 length:123 start_codon:yes stop_codon:yes gene_type:complete
MEPIAEDEENSLLEANLEQPIETKIVIEDLERSEIQHELS